MKFKTSPFFLFLFLFFLASTFSRAGTNKVRYHTNGQLKAAFERLQNQFPKLVHVETLAKTRGGEPILAIRVGEGTPKELDSRPGILVVGSVEGNHLVGSEVVLGVVQNLAQEFGRVDSVTALLRTRTVYTIPRLNPEGAAYYFKEVKWEHPWNNTPTDEDHDGLTDEDGPEDLNGDHLITLMRVKDPEGEFLSDAKNPELLRKADPAKGEVGMYKVYLEGKDSDGDGKYNEDGKGGVNIDWNFPQEYPAFKVGAGAYMESEPETRAISKFLFDHRNIGIALTYCLHDNLVHPPRPNRAVSTRKKPESSGRRWGFSSGPVKTIQKDDLSFFQSLSAVYRKIAKIPPKAEPVVVNDGGKGSLYKWVYFQAGIPSLATSLMLLPEGKARRAKRDSLKANPLKRRRVSESQVRPKAGKDELSADRKWLSYFKRTGERGFVPWKPFRHPQLGLVEIGGFAPFARTNPPATAIPDLVPGQTAFWMYLLKSLPHIEVQNLQVKKKGDRVYKISLVIRNAGKFPTSTAHGAKTRLVRPVLVKIFLKKGQLLTGNKVVFVPRLLGSGGSKKVEWLVTAPAGSGITIQVLSQYSGSFSKQIVLR